MAFLFLFSQNSINDHVCELAIFEEVQLCAQFIRYRREHDITQKALSEIIGLREARMSEILRYRHDRFTVDHLMTYLAKIKPNLKVKVA